MTHNGTITLETERLILRRFTIDDLKQIFNNCWSDPEDWKWTNYKPMHCVDDVIILQKCLRTKGWALMTNQIDTVGPCNSNLRVK